MRNPKIEGRTQYRPSGGVKWTKFVPFAALSLVAALVLAVVLEVLFTVGFYLVLLAPMLASLGLAGMIFLAVKKGHCRNSTVAALLGLIAGTILYLGYYYAGMVHDLQQLDPPVPARLSFLPKYIRFRMAHDVIKDMNMPDSDHGDEKPSGSRTGMNWATFSLEFGFVLVIAAGIGLRTSRKLYCERCQEWMGRETTTFMPEVGAGLVVALRQGSVQSLAALFTSPHKPAAPHTAVAMDCCPRLKQGQSKDCDLYLSIKQVIAPARNALDAFEQSKGKMLASQILLNREEIAALLPRFASLESVAGTTATEALKELQVEIKAAPPSQAMAEVTPVDPLYARKVLTTKVGLIVTAFSLLGILGVFVPIGLAALGAYLGFPQHASPESVPIAMKIIGSVLIGLAVLIFLGNMVMLFTFPDYFGRRYIRNLITREFRRRPKSLVTAADTGARLVEVVPRANWGSVKLFDCTDIGFVRVDRQRGELLFEGDKEYYRIPAAAITSCEIEAFVYGQGTHGATTLYRVVMQANHPSGFWEVPFAERGNIGKFRKKSREKFARELHAEISSLMASGRAAPTTV